MAYGQSEDELRRKELREEAERETEKMMERERLQKKEREEAHQKQIKKDIERLEQERSKLELAIRAIETETLQLDATIRRGVQVPPQRIERDVRESERSASDLQRDLRDVEKAERDTEQDIRQEEDVLRDLRGTLQDAKEKESRLVALIRENEHSLSTNRHKADEIADIEEKARKAKTRKEAQNVKLRQLEKQRDAVHQQIDALRRTVSK